MCFRDSELVPSMCMVLGSAPTLNKQTIMELSSFYGALVLYGSWGVTHIGY